MIKVKFLQDEIISFGPQRVMKDQELELPDTIAQQLILSGTAVSLEPAKVEATHRASIRHSKIHKEEAKKE